MNEFAWPLLVFLIPVVAIIGGFVITGFAIYGQIRKREFEHRERLAMIERGLAPATPATAAAGVSNAGREAWTYNRAANTRRGGFVVMGVGVGIFLLILSTGERTADAAGIGGFVLILGAAIFLSSFFGLDNRKPPAGPEGDAGRH